MSVILTPRITYKLNLDKMKLTIFGYDTPILGYPRTLLEYEGLKIAEAKACEERRETGS